MHQSVSGSELHTVLESQSCFFFFFPSSYLIYRRRRSPTVSEHFQTLPQVPLQPRYCQWNSSMKPELQVNAPRKVFSSTRCFFSGAESRWRRDLVKEPSPPDPSSPCEKKSTFITDIFASQSGSSESRLHKLPSERLPAGRTARSDQRGAPPEEASNLIGWV